MTYRIVRYCAGCYKIERRRRFLFIQYWEARSEFYGDHMGGTYGPMLFRDINEAKSGIQAWAAQAAERKSEEGDQEVFRADY